MQEGFQGFRGTSKFLNVLLATICVSMYMYHLFTVLTILQPPVEIAGSAAAKLIVTIDEK